MCLILDALGKICEENLNSTCKKRRKRFTIVISSYLSSLGLTSQFYNISFSSGVIPLPAHSSPSLSTNQLCIDFPPYLKRNIKRC